MARTFQDRDLLVWEVYPSAGDHGYSQRPHLVFNCLSERTARPRFVELDGDEADGEKLTATATDDDLRTLFERAKVVT